MNQVRVAQRSSRAPATGTISLASAAQVPVVPRLAIVVPCYNEELTVPEAADRLSLVLAKLTEADRIDHASFLYFVDDGSTDRTWDFIAKLHEQHEHVKGVRLARNVGTQHAQLAGLLGVRERVDCVVTIDADLQHDESAITSFIEKYQSGADIVYGVRRDRATDSALKRGTATLFYTLMNLMGARIVKNHSEYRLISKKALDALAAYGEYNLFLRGIFADIGLRSDIVFFDVRRRTIGKSKHTTRKLVSLAFDGITSFSVVPLRLLTLFGLIVCVFSFAMMLYVLSHVWRGLTIPGWAGITIPIYFLGGVQIMMIGLVGEYIGKIYKEVKARPRFIKDVELF